MTQPAPLPAALAEFLALAKAHVQAQEDAEAGGARWCWSIDQEEYVDAESEAQAHGDAIDRIESDALEEGEERAYWIARQKPAEAYLALRWLGESIADRLGELLEYDIGGEDPAVQLSADDQTDLGALVVAFVRARGGFVRFGIAQESIEEHQHFVGAEPPEPMRCPQCGGPADNGHDRELPPNVYVCKRCAGDGA